MKHKRTLEDYLKNIYLITCHKGYACNSELADALNISRPTVSVALKDIQNLGYISINENREIQLTDTGLKIAEETYERNQIFLKLLLKLGIKKEQAEIDACELEHAISHDSFTVFRTWLESNVK